MSKQLRVTAIGTGICSNAHPGHGGRRPPAFLLSYDKTLLLLDCGEGTRFALGEMGISHHEIKYVAVTHGHPDHSVLPQFIQSALCGRAFNQLPVQTDDRLRVFLPEPLAKSFDEVWRWSNSEETDLKGVFSTEIAGLANGSTFVIANGISLTGFDVYHGFGKHPAMGYRVTTSAGTVVYTGDAGFTEQLAKDCDGADLLIADCSTRIGEDYVHGYGHMTPKQCGELAKRAGVKTLWMTHYSGLDSEASMIEDAKTSGYTGTVIVATDGLIWDGEA